MTSESENSKKLNAFFNKEYNSLKNYINSRIKVGVNMDAEDIIQDVALKLFASADDYSPIKNVAGFVYHSIKNKIIDTGRVNKKVHRIENEMESKLSEFTEMMFVNSNSFYSEQLKKELKKNIANLKKDYRDIILAVDFEGYSYKEISLETGIPEGTLMSRRHRAIALLYKELETKKD